MSSQLRRGNPDASLFVVDAPARRAGAPRVSTLRGSFAGIAGRRGNGIRAGESAHSLARSNGCHGRSPRRCEPAWHNACSYTADSSFPWPPSTPPVALDNATNCGHKGIANVPLQARDCRRPGVLSRNVPGPSSIRRPYLRIAQTNSQRTPRFTLTARDVTFTTIPFDSQRAVYHAQIRLKTFLLTQTPTHNSEGELR